MTPFLGFQRSNPIGTRTQSSFLGAAKKPRYLRTTDGRQRGWEGLSKYQLCGSSLDDLLTAKTKFGWKTMGKSLETPQTLPWIPCFFSPIKWQVTAAEEALSACQDAETWHKSRSFLGLDDPCPWSVNHRKFRLIPNMEVNLCEFQWPKMFGPGVEHLPDLINGLSA